MPSRMACSTDERSRVLSSRLSLHRTFGHSEREIELIFTQAERLIPSLTDRAPFPSTIRLINQICGLRD